MEDQSGTMFRSAGSAASAVMAQLCCTSPTTQAVSLRPHIRTGPRWLMPVGSRGLLTLLGQERTLAEVVPTHLCTEWL